MFEKLKRALLGAPADVTNPQVFHNIALVALLAWVGLGADGLSSSAYGPDEAFRALGEHHYLAVLIALATTATVFIISAAYGGIIEHFPFGGGGYVVATNLLGPTLGVLSGCALLVDYVLTVAVSIASCADQVFSVLPANWHHWKLIAVAVVISGLVIINLRGVKESIIMLAPIFGLFLLTHAIMIVGGMLSHMGQFPVVAAEVTEGFQKGGAQLGLLGMAAIFLRAFSMGAGTFTGIEAVSNGLQLMREPKVQTGKRTMLYMAISLSCAASGIMICYLLFHVEPVAGKTMNAALLEKFTANWKIAGWDFGWWFVVITLASEAALLCVAAQASFIAGPRVMANMALDGWLPRRYTQLSDRLTMQDGMLLIGIASIAILFYTRGDITTLVTMYSINVFVTFSLSMFGMCKFWIKERKSGKKWKRGFAIQAGALAVCVSILCVVIFEKFSHGAWVTLVITSSLIAVCFMIRRHYRGVTVGIRQFDRILEAVPKEGEGNTEPVNPKQQTAVMLVGGFSGLGVHQLLQVQRMFPGQFKNFIYVSVGVIDSATMKGIEEVENTRVRTEEGLQKYVALTRRLGYPADYRMAIATEAVEESLRLCAEVQSEFPRSLFFMGKLLFEHEAWYHRFLHNDTAYQLQRSMHFAGMNAIVLTVRMLKPKSAKAIRNGKKIGKTPTPAAG